MRGIPRQKGSYETPDTTACGGALCSQPALRSSARADALRRGGYDATVSFEGSFNPTREDMREMHDYLASL